MGVVLDLVRWFLGTAPAELAYLEYAMCGVIMVLFIRAVLDLLSLPYHLFGGK